MNFPVCSRSLTKVTTGQITAGVCSDDCAEF